MHYFSRRRFFQFAGSTLGTLGLSQLSIKQQADGYSKVLAKSTPRKVALLVGINNYPRGYALEGCGNDVELQRHLLIHRFGFNDKDIHILKDKDATRQGILEAFEEYLITQTQPDDVVVFHYSGHGSRVVDPDPILSKSGQGGLSGTFVPVDAVLPQGYLEQGGAVKDIMGHTLFLLMSAVKSENFTAVLDSCFSGAATRDFRVRARSGGSRIQISAEEKSYQEKWLSRLSVSRAEFVKQYRTGVAKGVVLAATNQEQYAAEAPINGFNAGIFTYLLTQYLWRETSTPDSAVTYVKQKIPQTYNQNPRYEVKVGSGYGRQSTYFIKPQTLAADAVVTDITDKKATVWLGGVDLENIDNGTVFKVVDAREKSLGKVIFQSRQGLVGVGTVEGNVQKGALLQIDGNG